MVNVAACLPGRLAYGKESDGSSVWQTVGERSTLLHQKEASSRRLTELPASRSDLRTRALRCRAAQPGLVEFIMRTDHQMVVM